MNTITITSPKGISKIADRSEAGRSLPEISEGFDKREPGKITLVSSTVGQPFIGANYDMAGTFIGGRTMTQKQVDDLISAAKKNGWTIE